MGVDLELKLDEIGRRRCTSNSHPHRDGHDCIRRLFRDIHFFFSYYL